MSRTKKTKSTNKKSKRRGYGSSSGSSLLRELESKYSNESLPDTASVEKMMDELNSPSKKGNSSSHGVLELGLGLGLVIGLVIVGFKISKL